VRPRAFSQNEEPTLEEMLGDDVLKLVMARGRVVEEDVRRLAWQFANACKNAGRLPPGSQGPHSPTDWGRSSDDGQANESVRAS
jgi:hypothetical protein